MIAQATQAAKYSFLFCTCLRVVNYPHVAMLLYTQLDDNALFIKNFTVSPACLARPYTLRLRLEVQITFITAKACVKFVISFGYTYYIYIVTNGRKHM